MRLQRDEKELEVIRAIAGTAEDRPVTMLNLNRYTTEAGYPDGELYRAYMDGLIAFLPNVGAKILWRTPVFGRVVGDQTLHGCWRLGTRRTRRFSIYRRLLARSVITVCVAKRSTIRLFTGASAKVMDLAPSEKTNEGQLICAVGESGKRGGCVNTLKGAEARGFHSIWLGEHVVLFDNYDAEYPYEENGKIPVGGDRGLLEPITALSLWRRKHRVFGSAPGLSRPAAQSRLYGERNCCGRLSVARRRLWGGCRIARRGVHRTGLPLPVEVPGAEYLEVIKSLWTDDVSSYSGEIYQLELCRQYPKPVQQPGPPIYFGGECDAACAGSPISVPVGTDSMLRRKMFLDTC